MNTYEQGYDTKVMMSSQEGIMKKSSLELRVNVQIKRLVIVLFIICIVGALCSLAWEAAHNPWYLADFDHLPQSPRKTNTLLEKIGLFVVQFSYLFLLQGNFIPVSLYVSIR